MRRLWLNATPLKRLGAAILVLATIGIALKLAIGPLYERYDATQCREAYARARTRSDTVAVDFQPYASPHGGRNPRCGETRVTRPATAADIPVASRRD
jgi:hypothetical protein